MSAPDVSTGVEYTPYQQDFLNRFSKEATPGSVHLLLAPVGSGRSFAVAGALQALTKRPAVRRTLVLAPRTVLVSQWADRLGQRGMAPITVDGRVMRSLREQLGKSGSAWPDGIFLLSIDLGKRPDNRELLRTVPWDVLIVDSAQHLAGQRLELVEALTEQARKPSVLATCHALRSNTRVLFQHATVIDWGEAVAQFRAREGSDSTQLRRETLSYRRSEDEVEVIAGAIDVARLLGPVRGLSLLKSAASSISCLEESLVRAVETAGAGDENRNALDSLLERVEELRADARLERFKHLIQELVGTDTRHVVTFCDYRATLDYLESAVEHLEFADYSLHGGLSAQQRQEALSTFELNGGLLLATSAAEGVSLNFVDAAIHYDLPTSPAAFAQREGRYQRYGRTQPCTVYTFEDTSKALPLEGILLEQVTEADLVIGEADLDLEGLFKQAVGTAGSDDKRGSE